MSVQFSTVAPPWTTDSKAVATKIFIDEVSEYSLLSSCAEKRVSTLVRGMVSGCGDGSQMTSYLCFCQSSSSFFGSLIGDQIATTCSDQPQASLGQDVFKKYCQIGLTRGVLPAAASASPTPMTIGTETIWSTLPTTILSDPVTASTPASILTPSVSSRVFPSTPSSIAPTSSSATSDGRARTIAIAVAVPISIIALLVAAFLLHRYRKSRQGRTPDNGDSVELSNEKGGHALVSELPVEEKYGNDPVEMSTQRSRYSAVELPGHHVKPRT